MEADSPETGLEGLALSNEMRRAYKTITDNDYCHGTMPQHQESEGYTYGRYQDEPNARNPSASGGSHAMTANEYECVGFDPAMRGNGEAITAYVHAGFGLTDYYCDIFFRRLALHASGRHYAGSVANDVGTAVSAILGLTKAGSVATGAAGTAFGLIDSGLRNYDETFLVTPDLAALQKRVYDAQTAYAATVLTALPDSAPAANSAIIRYANFCSFVGMKGLLNESLTNNGDSQAMMTYIKAFIAKVDTMRPKGDADQATNTTNAAAPK